MRGEEGWGGGDLLAKVGGDKKRKDGERRGLLRFTSFGRDGVGYDGGEGRQVCRGEG